MGKKFIPIIKSEKVNKMLQRASWFWLLSLNIYIFLQLSNNLATDKPSKLSFVLKKYNPVFACLLSPFVIFLLIEVIEVFIIFLLPKGGTVKDKSLLSWLRKHFDISYKPELLNLKDETNLLVIEFLFCIFGFFIALKWYLIGAIAMLFYLCLYMVLNFQDIKKFFKNINS